MYVQIPAQVPACTSLGYIPRSKIAGLCGSLRLTFWGTTVLFSPEALLFSSPASNTQGSHFSTPSPTVVILHFVFVLIIAILINGCEVLS